MSKRKRKVKVSYNFAALRRKAYLAQGGLCWWCKQPMPWPPHPQDPNSATGDHLIPLHEGGKTRPGNIVAACRKCNQGRHPYLKRSKFRHDKHRVVASYGKDVPHSPFEVLRRDRS